MGIWRSPLVSAGLVGLLGIGSFAADMPYGLLWMRVLFACVLFVLPGGFIFSLMPVRDSWDAIDFIGYGFAISLVLMGILGLLARTFHWTFGFIEIIWYALTVLSLLTFLFKARNRSVRLVKCNGASAALLAIISVQALLFAYAGLFSLTRNHDRHTYNVEVTNFLREEPLDWQEIYYDTGNTISGRLYLTYWMLAQSLIVDVSGVHILQAQFIINSAVIGLEVMAIYIFARNLGHRPKAALVIVVLGLLCYSVLTQDNPQAGAQFFRRPIQDKLIAGFVLAPIAISTAYIWSTSRRRLAGVGFALSLLSMMFVHVMMAGFALAAIGLWCLLRIVFAKRERSNAIVIGMTAAVIFSPAILIRLNADMSPYHLLSADHLIWVDEESGLYAIRPDVAGGLTYILLTWVVLSLMLRPFDNRSMLMLAFALAVGIGLIPYTAWIYGRLTTILHMVRVVWILPYGYMLGFVLQTGCDRLCARVPKMKSKIMRLQQDKVIIPLLSLTIILTAVLLNVQQNVTFSKDISQVIDENEELLEAADYLESNHDERVWIVGSPEYRNVIPSLSSKAITLSHFHAARMRYYSGLSPDRATTQLDDNFRFYHSSVALEEKMAILDRYGIDYLLFDPDYSDMIDRLSDFAPERFETVYIGNSVKLVKVD